MRSITFGVLCGVMLFAAVASADDDADREMSAVKLATADPGIETANLSAIPWCDGVQRDRMMKLDRIDRGVQSAQMNGFDPEQLVTAATQICSNKAMPNWIKYASSILQVWMNHTHLKQADAVRSLTTRVTGNFGAQREALCKALEISPEIAGQVKTYSDAQRELFGCDRDPPAWVKGMTTNSAGVEYYLDGDTTADELMRVYWLLGYVPDPSNPSNPLPSKDPASNNSLLYYAVAQLDFARLDFTALDKQLSAAPYNDYAKSIVAETVALLQARRDAYEAILTKMAANDPDYTAILRDAPKAAFTRWDDLSKKWKTELDHSAAFEKLVSSPSHKVMAGCSPQLAADADKVVKAEQKTSFIELANAIANDPVASLLIERLAICYAVDNVWGMSGALDGLMVHHGRSLRGPRTLAYYAIVDAIAKASKDRPRMMLSLTNFYSNGGPLGMKTNFNKDEFKLTGRAPDTFGMKNNNHGQVESTKKVGDRIEIKFKQVKVKVADYNCTDDRSHPLNIDNTGQIHYYRNCSWPGTFTVEDHTPEPMKVAAQLAPILTPGTYVDYEPIPEGAKMAGVVVFTKKSADANTITSFFGFPL
jgi:hypothetical protein